MASPVDVADSVASPLRRERNPLGAPLRGVQRARTVVVDIGFRYQLTRLALMFERLAAPALGVAGVVALFAMLAWSGTFWALGPTGRMLLVLAFLPLTLFALWQFRHFRLPSVREIEQRLDRSRPEAHRPLETLSDQLSGSADGFAAALWQVHRLRAAEAAASLKARPGDAKLRSRDPYALRFLAILALIVSAFIAGDERQARLASAFDWSAPKPVPVPPRLDAWIDPPGYTGRPPIFLTGAVSIAPGEVIRAPIGATFTVRSTVAVTAEAAERPAVGGERRMLLELRHDAGLAEPPQAKGEGEPAGRVRPASAEKPGVETVRRIIRADSQVNVLRDGQDMASFRFAVIPDLPPKAVLTEVKAEPAAPERQAPGGIRVNYTLEDDYGIAKAELLIERLPGKAGAAPSRTLLPPPVAAISTRLGAGETALATEDHPWAGEEVAVRLVVEDDLGQRAESETMRVTLPRRPFSQPLARALVEQRRNLVFGPDRSQDVVLAFDALLYEPERFTPKVADFLALDSMRAGIKSAGEPPATPDDPDIARAIGEFFERREVKAADPGALRDRKLTEMVASLYELALFLENGDMTDAERRLREAEARLREALDREAPQNEIRRLSEELRRAMEQFLREFAERALREQDRNADNDRQPNPSERFLTQRDLNDMLRRIEEMARSGNMDEAKRLLNELRQLMENLRMARRQDMDPRRRELSEQLEELDRLQREQRDLRDRTFRQGQQRNQRGQQQQGQRQQGQRQQGQRQPGQGQEQGDGEGEEDLQKQQQALRDRLKQLRDRLKQQGQQEGEGFGEAEDGMGDAEGQLGQGRPGQATEGQQRAVDGLGRAAQGLAQQLDQQMGEGEGEGEGQPFGQPGPGNRGRADNRTDPLGRPQPNSRRDVEDNSRVQVPDQNTIQKSISERAEQVLRELRRRLGDFERPREELDYLERLLRQR